MNVLRITRYVVFGGFLCQIVACQCVPVRKFPSEVPSAPDAAIINEANAKFSYKGQPIHPRLLQQFQSWVSRSGPTIDEVDVSNSFDDNPNFKPVRIFGSLVECVTKLDDDRITSYGYTYVGRLADGTHVVRTEYSGGGSGVFETLMFVRFALRPSLDLGYAETKQLVMRICGIVWLGDRSGVRVQIQQDDVMISDPKDDANRIVVAPRD